MSTETDEALLRRAAQTVRERAKGTSIGPWTEPKYDDTDQPGFPFWMIHNGGVGMREHAVVSTFPLNHQQEQDARWITLVGPQIAEPLAAWLDDTADNVRGRWNVGALAPPNHITSALIFARTVLSEATR